MKVWQNKKIYDYSIFEYKKIFWIFFGYFYFDFFLFKIYLHSKEKNGYFRGKFK